MITRSLPLVALMRSQWEEVPGVQWLERLRELAPENVVARAVAVDFTTPKLAAGSSWTLRKNLPEPVTINGVFASKGMGWLSGI